MVGSQNALPVISPPDLKPLSPSCTSLTLIEELDADQRPPWGRRPGAGAVRLDLRDRAQTTTSRLIVTNSPKRINATGNSGRIMLRAVGLWGASSSSTGRTSMTAGGRGPPFGCTPFGGCHGRAGSGTAAGNVPATGNTSATRPPGKTAALRPGVRVRLAEDAHRHRNDEALVAVGPDGQVGRERFARPIRHGVHGELDVGGAAVEDDLADPEPRLVADGGGEDRPLFHGRHVQRVRHASPRLALEQ